MTHCPSDLELEIHLALPGRSLVAKHVACCDACRRQLEELRTAESRPSAAITEGRSGVAPRVPRRALLPLVAVVASALWLALRGCSGGAIGFGQ